MDINTLIEDDLELVYENIADEKMLLNGSSVNVFYANSYDIQSMREKLVVAQTKDVAQLSNNDIVEIEEKFYKVISFAPSDDGLETTIGLELE